MARERQAAGIPDGVISIIGPGMKVVGDLETEGTLRIEGDVRGTVRAGKAVVVGKDGSVDGDIHTQDAVVSGTVMGSLVAESRLEVQATARIEGDVRALRMQLEEGAVLNGNLAMGPGEVAAGGPRAVPAEEAVAARAAAS
jgi:cytoskeletal protein CcmA (bactofilin family)